MLVVRKLLEDASSGVEGISFLAQVLLVAQIPDSNLLVVTLANALQHSVRVMAEPKHVDGVAIGGTIIQLHPLGGIVAAVLFRIQRRLESPNVVVLDLLP